MANSYLGEQTHHLRRQAIVAQRHFMLDRDGDIDVAVAIEPKDLPNQ